MSESPGIGPTPPGLAGSTLCEAFQITARERGGAQALRSFETGYELSFAELADRVRALAAGLHALGVRHGDTVALMLVNRPEFNIVDTAAMHLGAIPFSVYNSSSASQVNYIFRNAGNRIVVTERQFLPRVMQARTPELEHIVLVDDDAPGTITLADVESRTVAGFDFESSWRAVQPEDVVTLIYTSGTTGEPKAVQLTHGGVMFQNRALAEMLPALPGDKAISYLPSAHVGDRTSAHYGGLICCGIALTTLADYRQVGAALAAVRPDVFGGVPRVWEKLKAGLESAGVRNPAELPAAARTAVKARIGLERARWCVSSAAPISPDVLRYFVELGLPLVEGWGMSEISLFGTMNPLADARAGTVGRALPGVELQTADDGELMVRGPLVMKGYRGDPERTREALDSEGWLHTGDIAAIDADGYVRIVDRKKEIIINSAGKNMSPASIEFRLRAASPLVAFAVCIGDRRPYNTALLVLDPEILERWRAGQPAADDSGGFAPSQDPALRALLAAAVEKANAQLSRVEQIKRFEILDDAWQPGGDELTPTSKLKRRAILTKYAHFIERLYE